MTTTTTQDAILRQARTDADRAAYDAARWRYAQARSAVALKGLTMDWAWVSEAAYSEAQAAAYAVLHHARWVAWPNHDEADRAARSMQADADWDQACGMASFHMTMAAASGR